MFSLDKDWFRRNWGLAFCLFEVLLGLVVTYQRPPGGHFLLVCGAHEVIGQGQPPYLVDFPGNPGWFFYSPLMATLLAVPFCSIPLRLGQALYVTGGAVFLLLGLLSWLRVLRVRGGFDLSQSRWRHLFWLILGSEYLGAVQAIKLELWVLGLVFFGAALLVNRKNWVWGIGLLSLATNLKLQPLPVLGLAILYLSLTYQTLTPLVLTVGWSLVWFFLPALAPECPDLLPLHQAWLSALAYFSGRDWMAPTYQHIYAFVGNTFGLVATPARAFRITLCFAVALVGFFIWLVRKYRGANRDVLALGLAMALGMPFALVFSGLSQSNAYILFAPLLLFVFVLQGERPLSSRVFYSWLVGIWFVISLVYSDLVPRFLHDWCFNHDVKPVGLVALYGLVVAYGVRQPGTYSR